MGVIETTKARAARAKPAVVDKADLPLGRILDGDCGTVRSAACSQTRRIICGWAAISIAPMAARLMP